METKALHEFVVIGKNIKTRFYIKVRICKISLHKNALQIISVQYIIIYFDTATVTR